MQVEILDTAGQDAYTALRETFMHTGDGFLLVYSITDDQTFEELRSIREQILRVHRDRKVPMIVVGNKVDLANDRAVSKEEGSKLASEFGAQFMEVTAKEDFKVKDSFQALIRMILAKNPKAGQESAGAGGVFGAGVVDHSGDVDVEIAKQKKKSGGSGNKKKSGNNEDKADLGSAKSASKSKSTSSEKDANAGKCHIL